MKQDRAGVIFVDVETCYVANCPSPHIDHDWYPEEHQTLMRKVLTPFTGKRPVAFRHRWHGVGSGRTGEQTEYILDPQVAKSMCEYELSRVGIDEAGPIYSKTSRLETFSLILDELKHYNLIY